MSAYFNAHPVTADMGLREAINAMLKHVAYNRHDFGYLPHIPHAANHEALLDSYSSILFDNGGVLELESVIKDSDALNYLVDTLIGLSNDYPVLDDETYSRIEDERILEAAELALSDARHDYELGRILSAPDERVTPEDLAYALHATSADIEQSEYGAAWSDSDMADALVYAVAELDRAEAEANGRVPMF